MHIKLSEDLILILKIAYSKLGNLSKALASCIEKHTDTATETRDGKQLAKLIPLPIVRPTSSRRYRGFQLSIQNKSRFGGYRQV